MSASRFSTEMALPSWHDRPLRLKRSDKIVTEIIARRSIDAGRLSVCHLLLSALWRHLVVHGTNWDSINGTTRHGITLLSYTIEALLALLRPTISHAMVDKKLSEHESWVRSPAYRIIQARGSATYLLTC